MKLPVGIFAFLTLTLYVHCYSISDLISISSQKTSSQMNAYVSSSSPGEITIFKDLDGFYVNADLADPSSSSNSTVKMMLSLSSSDVLLIQKNCLDFKQYSCPYYRCTKYPNNQKTVSYPDFTAETVQASAFISLDQTYWELQGKAMLATSCSTKRDDLKGNNRYGVIGMGTQGVSRGNFLKSKIFSVYFPDSDVRNGTFKFSAEEVDGFYFWNSFTANANWIVPMKGFIQYAAFTQGFTGSMVFDINADAIGFPPSLFESFISRLQENQWMQGLSCTNDIFQPTCNYTGYIRDLPEIDINAGQPQNNGRRFDIKPEIYVLNAKSQDDYVYSITLNLQALSSSSSSGKSFVTSDYENTIVLDARAMSYFYIIFNATGPTNTISLYDVKGILNNGTSDSIINQIGGRHIIVFCTQASPVIIVDNSTTIVNAGVQNHFYQPQNSQYMPPQYVGHAAAGGYVPLDNQHL